MLWSPGIDSKESAPPASVALRVAGRHNNPIPTRFLVPTDCLKIPEKLHIRMSKPLLLVSVGPRAHADLEEPAIPQRAPPNLHGGLPDLHGGPLRHKSKPLYLVDIVAGLHHIDAGPNLTFHSDAVADSDLTLDFDADPPLHQSDGRSCNCWPTDPPMLHCETSLLICKPLRLQDEPQWLQDEPPWLRTVSLHGPRLLIWMQIQI
jgi:hypothetical protein